MNEFILNKRLVRTDSPASLPLLDFIRGKERLCGTKIGCREGDCGACTVLLGSLDGEKVRYDSVTSCIAPLGNAFGKHVVTIDGLKMESLSPVQQSLVDHGGTQCGFCTPGFVVSMTGYCLSCETPSSPGAVAAVDGNICRCTGYQSIERALTQVIDQLEAGANPSEFVPAYFTKIPRMLSKLQSATKGKAKGTIVGGGTDLYVQRPEQMSGAPIQLFADRGKLKHVEIKNGICRIGASSTATDLLKSAEMNQLFPKLPNHLKLVSSTQIRNMGTVAGNVVNASPIGDLTIFFLALDAEVVLRNGKEKTRTVPLREFYRGYKQLAMKKGETIERLDFQVPGDVTAFNFEKVSKRTHLDIASVNSAISIQTSADDRIENAFISAGGVGPIPTFLSKTCDSLLDQPLTPKTVQKSAKVALAEISPISDARGSAEYKSLLLRQLLFAHFIELFPTRFSLGQLA